jgi:hypothetical protein
METEQYTGGLANLDRDAADTLARVRHALRGLRFGEVRIVVHEGSVVQVERTEKVRLPLSRPPSPA